MGNETVIDRDLGLVKIRRGQGTERVSIYISRLPIGFDYLFSLFSLLLYDLFLAGLFVPAICEQLDFLLVRLVVYTFLAIVQIPIYHLIFSLTYFQFERQEIHVYQGNILIKKIRLIDNAYALMPVNSIEEICRAETGNERAKENLKDALEKEIILWGFLIYRRRIPIPPAFIRCNGFKMYFAEHCSVEEVNLVVDTLRAHAIKE